MRVFGDEHPSTLNSMANMAMILYGQSRNTEAISLMEECFQLRKRILDDHHPNTEASIGALILWTMEDMGLVNWCCFSCRTSS